jgi:hypothetical protein
MNMGKISKFAMLFAVLLVCLVAAGTVNSALAITGAIYTTDSTCKGVDINIYSSKDDVYLDGGPRGGGSGLPDGYYYVRVIAPSGILLGTSVGSNNETPVQVINGSFNGCYQLSAILLKATDNMQGYDNTPTPGGEYKVDVSSVSTFDPNESKEDNFKVVKQGEEFSIGGVKYYDNSPENGTFDSGELTIPDWTIKVDGTFPDNTTFSVQTQTDSTGNWSLIFPKETTYTACEDQIDGFNQTGPIPETQQGGAKANSSKCWVGTVGAQNTVGLDFGNVCDPRESCIPPTGERLDVEKTVKE